MNLIVAEKEENGSSKKSSKLAMQLYENMTKDEVVGILKRIGDYTLFNGFLELQPL